jgi:hypothetical protein
MKEIEGEGTEMKREKNINYQRETKHISVRTIEK